MTAADGIDTHLLEQYKLAAERVGVECRSQAAQIVMHAHAVDFHILAVEPESGLGIKTERAKACGR